MLSVNNNYSTPVVAGVELNKTVIEGAIEILNNWERECELARMNRIVEESLRLLIEDDLLTVRTANEAIKEFEDLGPQNFIKCGLEDGRKKLSTLKNVERRISIKYILYIEDKLRKEGRVNVADAIASVIKEIK